MAFKGKSTIELRNAETGELEQRVEDENMITNAAYNLINGFNEMNNLKWMFFPKNQFVPLLSHCFGGLLMYENNLTEDTNNILIPENNLIIGHASKTYTGDDVTRGTLNTSESKEIKDGKGYRYVWDFPTDRGNGTIRCVSLTSEKGGGSGLIGSIGSGLLDDGTDTRRGGELQPTSYGFFVGYFKKNTFLYANCDAGGRSVTFYNCETFIKMTLKTNDTQKITEKTVTSTLRLCEGKKYQQVGDKLYSIYPYDTNKLDVVVFDGVTLEIISENTYVVQDAIFFTSGNSQYGEKNSLYFNGNFYVFGNRNDHDGKLYERVYKININDVSDYSVFEVNVGGTNYYGCRTSVIGSAIFFCSIGNAVYASSEYATIYDGTNLYKCNNANGTSGCTVGAIRFVNSPILKPPYLISGYGNMVSLFIWAPFLSTINNLSTPVVKNETQTMKVTYEITEI